MAAILYQHATTSNISYLENFLKKFFSKTIIPYATTSSCGFEYQTCNNHWQFIHDLCLAPQTLGVRTIQNYKNKHSLMWTFIPVKTCASLLSMTQSLPRPSRLRRSSVKPAVGQLARWLCPHPAVQQQAGSSSVHDSQCQQSLLVKATSEVSAAVVDYDAQCHILAALRLRVSVSGRHTVLTVTSDKHTALTVNELHYKHIIQHFSVAFFTYI